jgi:hypothetical protein
MEVNDELEALTPRFGACSLGPKLVFVNEFMWRWRQIKARQCASCSIKKKRYSERRAGMYRRGLTPCHSSPDLPVSSTARGKQQRCIGSTCLKH